MKWKGNAKKIPNHRCWYVHKICYDKKGALSAKNKRYSEDKVELRPYWCDKCNFWHLTKNINYIHFMSEETIVEEATTTEEVVVENPSEDATPVEGAPEPTSAE